MQRDADGLPLFRPAAGNENLRLAAHDHEPMTMNVSLSLQLEAMVKAKVASGRYTSASEVVREALRLMEQQDQLRELQLEPLRQEIQNGLNSGKPVTWIPEAIKAEGRDLLQASAPSNQDD